MSNQLKQEIPMRSEDSSGVEARCNCHMPSYVKNPMYHAAGCPLATPAASPAVGDASLVFPTGERITRKDLNNAYRAGQENGRLFAEFFDTTSPSPAPAAVVCAHCDGTGDVHGIDGEWKGQCSCKAKDAL